MEYTANNIIDNFNRLQSNRSALSERVQRCRAFVNPGRSRVAEAQYVDASQRKPEKAPPEIVVNHLAAHALVYSRGMSSNLFPPSSKWFSFGCRKIPMIKDFLASAAQAMYDLLYSSSNFSAEMNECIEDTVDAGTVCISCEADPERGVKFKTHDFGTFFVEESRPGRKDIVYRMCVMTALQAVNFFRDGDDTLPQKIRDDGTNADNGKSGRTCRIIHAVLPNRDREYAEDGTPKPGKRNKPYLSLYVDTESKTIIRKSGYERCPYVVGNIDNPGSGIYSDSPMQRCLRTAELLNKIYATLIDATELAVKPSVLADLSSYDRILPQYFFEPGQVNLYDSHNGQANKPEFYVPPANLPLGFEFAQSIDKQCEIFFSTDLFTMITRLNQESGRQRTAYEIQQLAAERNNMILPLVARFLDEVVSPLLRLAFFTALDQGMFANAPSEILMLREEDVDLQYYSPLALAAQRNRVTGTLSALETLTPIGQTMQSPEIFDIFDMDSLARDIAESYGAYPEHLRKKNEIEKIRTQRAQAAQQAQAAAQAADIAKSQNLTGPVDRTSLAGALVNGGGQV